MIARLIAEWVISAIIFIAMLATISGCWVSGKQSDAEDKLGKK